MRISDWSSDVCSSDLPRFRPQRGCSRDHDRWRPWLGLARIRLAAPLSRACSPGRHLPLNGRSIYRAEPFEGPFVSGMSEGLRQAQLERVEAALAVRNQP